MKEHDGWITYLRISWKGKWIILFCFLVGMGHGLYQFLTVARSYQTEISLMLLEDNNSGTGIGEGLSGLLQLGGQGSSQEWTILNILQSRHMAQDIADHFQFEKRYHLNKSAAVKKAMGMIYAETFRKLIVITATAEEKQLAVDLAYFCSENLEHFNQELEISGRKKWTKILDTPELSLRLANREPQKRFMIMESLLGVVIGFAIVFGYHYFVRIRKVLVESS